MSTYTQIVYQIVFSTKNRERTLVKPQREELFKYIGGLISNKKCHPYIINGVEDHLHIATSLHPSVALATLIKDIKLSTSDFIKSNRLFKNFSGWQDGYGAFTYGKSDLDRLVRYIQNQEEHHKIYSFKEEYIEFLKENGISFDEKYLL